MSEPTASVTQTATTDEAPASEPLLEVHDLHVAYQRVIRVLHGIHLRVDERSCVALLGSNGAGKSTTLKAVSGMLEGEGQITAGHIRLAGQDVTGQPAHRQVRRGLVHVLEGRFVFPDLTVRDNLRMGAYSRRDRKRVPEDQDRVLKYFPRLQERINLEAGYLSGGEQQMLAIARALMARPRVLLLDEPSMGLAPLLVKEVFEIIERIRREETLTVLLVEQNARMALRVSDYAYLIDTGRIVLEGPADQIHDDPRLREVYLGGLGH